MIVHSIIKFKGYFETFLLHCRTYAHVQALLPMGTGLGLSLTEPYEGANCSMPVWATGLIVATDCHQLLQFTDVTYTVQVDVDKMNFEN